MTFTYDPEGPAAYLRITDSDVFESQEVALGLVLDRDEDGYLVGFEFLQPERDFTRGFLARHEDKASFNSVEDLMADLNEDGGEA